MTDKITYINTYFVIYCDKARHIDQKDAQAYLSRLKGSIPESWFKALQDKIEGYSDTTEDNRE